MKLLIVGGSFDDNGGRPSSMVSKFAQEFQNAGIEVETFNGGNFSEIEYRGIDEKKEYEELIEKVLKKCFEIENIEITSGYVSFTEKSENEEIKYKVKIPGKFSVYNALTAISIAKEFGCSPKEIQAGFDGLKVPGRSEIVDIGTDYTVMVDYAHSPDSLKNILLATREYVKGAKRFEALQIHPIKFMY